MLSNPSISKSFCPLICHEFFDLYIKVGGVTCPITTFYCDKTVRITLWPYAVNVCQLIKYTVEQSSKRVSLNGRTGKLIGLLCDHIIYCNLKLLKTHEKSISSHIPPIHTMFDFGPHSVSPSMTRAILKCWSGRSPSICEQIANESNYIDER